MTTRILLIRAVNVGGARLPMAELRALLERLGATEVRTYIASGNAVAEVPGDSESFDRALETALTEAYGWHREVVSRTPVEVAAALAAHPFEVAEPKHSYVCFLTAAPDPEAVARAGALPTGEDAWAVDGAELHLRYAHGAGRPELDLACLLRALGVQGTARNLATVESLVRLAAG